VRFRSWLHRREDAGDAVEHLLEAGDFGLEMLESGWGDFIDADAAVGGRGSPFGGEETGLQKALESGIEGAFLDLEEIVGGALDVLGKGVAVERLTLEGLQDHHFEGAGEEVAGFLLGHTGLRRQGCCFYA
jgi:hypothetical protein